MKRKILAVDDEIHMLRLLERVISKKTPYVLMTTHNSLEVPTILEREQFDVIITDLKMRGMDGFDILHWIKENERAEEVIIITAFGSPDIAKEAFSKGAFDYITKPFRKEKLLFALKRAMQCCELKQEMARLTQLFNIKPYQDAIKAFEREYARQLVTRQTGDPKEMAANLGISEEAILMAQKDKQHEDL